MGHVQTRAPLPACRSQEPAGERLHPGDVALLGASSPLPASQPPRLSGGKGVAPRCHWALAGHGESGWACAGASVGVLPRAQRAAEGPFDRGWPAVSSARRPSQSRVTNSHQGTPFCLCSSSQGLVSSLPQHLCCLSPVGLVVRHFVFRKLCH